MWRRRRAGRVTVQLPSRFSLLRNKGGVYLQYLVTGTEMRLLDQNTSKHFFVPELVLMEQAAMAFVGELFLLMKERGASCRKALIVCGSGNNGADGLAAARLLTQKGMDAVIWPAGEDLGLRQSDSYRVQRKICAAYGIPVVHSKAEAADADLVIDAVFGIGLSRDVEGALAEILAELNRTAAWHVAIDISSGLSADTGAVLGCAFRADDTVTFSFGKIGQYLWPGNEYSGAVHVVPIGITMESYLSGRPRMAAIERSDLAILPKRRAHSNKGTYGKLLVAAGSVNMAGAAILCALAAYRVGTGLVRILTPEENRLIIQTAVPEAILSTYDALNPEEAVLAEALDWADAIVAGPGIGTGEGAGRLLDAVLSRARVPAVLDADALNLLAGDLSRLSGPHGPRIVTPHLGEMARLTGKSVKQLQSSLAESADEFAERYDCICVLKDFRTVTAVPQGLTYLNLSGNSGMATAGSGDVLSGVIAGLLAQGMKDSWAAVYGVYIHGLAGDAAAARTGERALMASDIVDGLTELK